MNFQNSISSKEFCKKNCGGCSKEKFFEEYYRILHTAYLRSNNSSCLDVIRNDFENSFGTDLDTASVSYIYATSKYLVYDVVVAALLSDGRVDSQYYFYKLVIELGFDVWLIGALESGVRLTMDYFYEWLPLQKNEKTERAVSDFWHFRLPKAHKFSHLYDGIKQYKREILITYRKLLLAKNDIQLDRDAANKIIFYIDGLIPRKKNSAPASKTVNTHAETVEAVAVPAEPVTAPSEPVAETVTESVAEEITKAVETAEEQVAEAVETVEEQAAETVKSVEEQAAEAVEVVEIKAVDTAEAVAESIEEQVAENIEAVNEQSETVLEPIEMVSEKIENVVLQPSDDLFFGRPNSDIQEIVDSGNALEAVAVAATVAAVAEVKAADDVPEVKTAESSDAFAEVIEEAEYDDAPVLPDNTKEMELVLAEEEPVPEKPEVQPEVKEEAPVQVDAKVENKPSIKVVDPADYIPYKTENRDFVSDRNKNVLHHVEKSINSEKSCRGFKKNCSEITKDKLVTAAVCVGIASVLLVPLAITCFGKKGKKK